MFKRFFSLSILFLEIHILVFSQTTVDSTLVHENANVKKNLLISAGLFTYGGLISSDICFVKDENVNDYYRRKFPDFQTNADNFLAFVPASLPYILDWSGIKAKNRFWDRSFAIGASYAVALASAEVLKRSINKLRPNAEDNKSFPSGHTTIAFASAHFAHKELKDQGWGYSVLSYGIAIGVANLRMMNEKHWISDVVAGAGLGIASVEAGYWIASKIRKPDNLTFVPGLQSVFLVYQF